MNALVPDHSDAFNCDFPKARMTADGLFLGGKTALQRIEKWALNLRRSDRRPTPINLPNDIAFESSWAVCLGGYILLPLYYDRELVNVMRQVPKAYWRKDLKAWQVPVESGSALSLRIAEIDHLAGRARDAYVERVENGYYERPRDPAADSTEDNLRSGADIMNPASECSPFFSYIYDETAPSEGLGRGTHYSVIRVPQSPVERGEDTTSDKVRDIAIIWDEDHDVRIITAIERLYRRNLLSGVLFIGERKGSMTVLVDEACYFGWSRYQRSQYLDRVAAEVASIGGDSWQVSLGSFSPSGVNDRTLIDYIINADEQQVQSYLRAIGVRWQLGSKSSEHLDDPKAWSDHEQRPRDSSSTRQKVPDWMLLEHTGSGA